MVNASKILNDHQFTIMFLYPSWINEGIPKLAKIGKPELFLIPFFRLTNPKNWESENDAAKNKSTSSQMPDLSLPRYQVTLEQNKRHQ